MNVNEPVDENSHIQGTSDSTKPDHPNSTEAGYQQIFPTYSQPLINRTAATGSGYQHQNNTEQLSNTGTQQMQHNNTASKTTSDNTYKPEHQNSAAVGYQQMLPIFNQPPTNHTAVAGYQSIPYNQHQNNSATHFLGDGQPQERADQLPHHRYRYEMVNPQTANYHYQPITSQLVYPPHQM